MVGSLMIHSTDDSDPGNEGSISAGGRNAPESFHAPSAAGVLPIAVGRCSGRELGEIPAGLRHR